jgi:DNA-binding beta-propeller fold protein YncE
MENATFDVELIPRRLARALVVAMVTAAGCGDDGEPSATSNEASSSETQTSGNDTETTGAPFAGRLLVTADWRNKSLTLVDFDALAAGATTREEIVVGEIPLTDWEPGPLEVEVTPDGQRAVVAVSPGFFDGVIGNTIGVQDVPLGGTLLVVDLMTREVVADIATAHVPLGIAISADGSTAYTANYGHSDAPGSTMSVVDLNALTVTQDVEVGQRPEQVSLHPDGSLGIINLAGDGTVVLFDPADPAGTLSTPLDLSADPSDVDFIPGTNRAVVANSLNPFTYSVIDVSDPSMPTHIADGMPPTGFPYAITPVPGTTDFIMTLANDSIGLVRADATAPAMAKWDVAVDGVASFPMGVAVDAGTGLAFVGAAGANVLVVQPLDGSAARTIPWLSEAGPTYVAIAGP